MEQSSNLKPLNYGGWTTFSDTANGIFPIFSAQLGYRINRKKACNITIGGEPGDGKSYFAIMLAMVLDSRFNVEKQVVFTLKEFIQAVMKLPMGRPIVFDEPSYAMGKRDWYKELNKALVLTIESFRYKVHPLLIPVVNPNLLDKTIRHHLIQYHIHVLDRGLARVYRLSASQWEDKVYRTFLCNLRYKMLGIDECSIPTCLDCKQLKKGCMIWRAEYERKKDKIQSKRYTQTMGEAEVKESREYTTKEIEGLAYSIKHLFWNEDTNRYDPVLMMIHLEDEFQLKIGDKKARNVLKRLKVHHKEEFDKPPFLSTP